jgi:hypothetical protein
MTWKVAVWLTAYAGLWAAFSAYATMAAIR